MFNLENQINLTTEEVLAKSEMHIAIKLKDGYEEASREFAREYMKRHAENPDGLLSIVFNSLADIFSGVQLKSEECDDPKIVEKVTDKYLELFTGVFKATFEIAKPEDIESADYFARYAVVNLFIIEQDCPIKIKKQAMETVIKGDSDLTEMLGGVEELYLASYIQLLIKLDHTDLELLKKYTARLKLLIRQH